MRSLVLADSSFRPGNAGLRQQEIAMLYAIPKKKITFGEAVRYRIAVQGRISADTAGRLGRMEVVDAGSAVRAGITVLEGLMRDQAELSGVLNTLYDSHFPILEVKALGIEESPGNPNLTRGAPDQRGR